MEAPGDCSPSRKVVSKIISLSVMAESSCWAEKSIRCFSDQGNAQSQTARMLRANGPLT
jgi:hypothetical protein